MRTSIPRPKNVSILILAVVLIFDFPSFAQTTDPFSFDRALQIYNDVNTASQLTDYLKTASADDQKDYRYTLYRIRGYYASYQFPEGDAPAPIHESRLRLGDLLKTKRSADRWWSSDKADWKSVVVT